LCVDSAGRRWATALLLGVGGGVFFFFFFFGGQWLEQMHFC